MTEGASSRPQLRVVRGDITQLDVEAIVTAANPSLLGGGGVDGAIHRAAGPRLVAHTRTLGGCATGRVVVTPAFDLEARGIRAIIHAVGPVWGSDPDATGDEPLGYRREDIELAFCYTHALDAARNLGCRSIAFPAISTGIYGFPKERAARIAVGHVRASVEREGQPAEVVFAVFDEDTERTYQALLTPKTFQDGIQLGERLRRHLGGHE